jgi:hypothetical protein
MHESMGGFFNTLFASLVANRTHRKPPSQRRPKSIARMP